jgi:hypothetical protein
VSKDNIESLVATIICTKSGNDRRYVVKPAENNCLCVSGWLSNRYKIAMTRRPMAMSVAVPFACGCSNKDTGPAGLAADGAGAGGGGAAVVVTGACKSTTAILGKPGAFSAIRNSSKSVSS